MKKNCFRLFDFLLFVLIFCAGLYLTVNSLKKSEGTTAIVDANGQRYEYSLKQNGIYSVDGALGKTVFKIEDSKICILESACPNKTCIEQGWTTPLVCLPNKVIITVENYGEFDAFTE